MPETRYRTNEKRNEAYVYLHNLSSACGLTANGALCKKLRVCSLLQNAFDLPKVLFSILNSIITFTFSSSFCFSPSPSNLMSQGFCYVCFVFTSAVFHFPPVLMRKSKKRTFFLCRYQQQLATTGESYKNLLMFHYHEERRENFRQFSAILSLCWFSVTW